MPHARPSTTWQPRVGAQTHLRLRDVAQPASGALRCRRKFLRIFPDGFYDETRRAAHEYGFPFDYHFRPSWKTYASLLEFAGVVRRNLCDLRPRDMIDIQSFLWVQGAEEHSEQSGAAPHSSAAALEKMFPLCAALWSTFGRGPRH
jgi:hypothetical protein